MRKWILSFSGLMIIILVGMAASSRWFWTLPFMPERWRANFQLSANILPASDDSRAQFLAINPGFRAEFGDKQNPTSAFLRFEKTKTTLENTDRDINANLIDQLAIAQLLSDYQPGLEWQLFNVSIDETHLDHGQTLAADQEILDIAHDLLDTSTISPESTDLEQAVAAAEKIQTETVVARHQGFDTVQNLEVAPNVDLQYTVLPGKGINSSIIIGDRRNFDTACLQMLSLTGSEAGCNLPSNKFSFLLQLDEGQKLAHDPLSVDSSQTGTYYITDEQGQFLYRLGNPQLHDAAGNTTAAVGMEIRPGQVGGQDIANFYIVTYTADLGWLIDSARTFPASLKTGFYIDGQELFTPITSTPAETIKQSTSPTPQITPSTSPLPTEASDAANPSASHEAQMSPS